MKWYVNDSLISIDYINAQGSKGKATLYTRWMTAAGMIKDEGNHTYYIISIKKALYDSLWTVHSSKSD